jgi:primosomal protein N' (replication factor Y)
MSTKGGLTLKREVFRSEIVTQSSDLPVADIYVDAGVYHLDSLYSYLVPEKYSEVIGIGTLVSIPFHGREIVGIVRTRRAGEVGGLKAITKPLGSIPLATGELLLLIEKLSMRYAAHPFDIIRSALPDRVATVEREFNENQTSHTVTKSGRRKQQYLQLPPAKKVEELLANKIIDQSKSGGVLTVVPDLRTLARLSHELQSRGITHITYDSSQAKSDLYRNFLQIRLGLSKIVIGTRNAVFMPVHQLSAINVLNEGSEHFYERRTPGWSVRDVAIIRGQIEGCNLNFIGYSPSTEIARLIDEEWIEYRRTRAKVKVDVFPSQFGELLPSRALSIAKKTLQSGPILFIVPLKGYAQAIRCAHCRTISRCECGGALEQRGKSSSISCSHCTKEYTQWRCSWCQHQVPALSQRGIERHLHEIAQLLPNVPVVLSTADHVLDFSPDKGIVIATPSMAPETDKGYAGVFILEGNRFLSQPDLRARERVRDLYFSHAALARDGAPIVLVQDEGDSISTALATWNPSSSIHGDLSERMQLQLPPYVRTARLTMEKSEITRLRTALEKSRDEGRIPASTKILGPIDEGASASIILSVPLHEGEMLVNTIHDFMRLRSASKKSLPSLRIDPYSLSH